MRLNNLAAQSRGRPRRPATRALNDRARLRSCPFGVGAAVGSLHLSVSFAEVVPNLTHQSHRGDELPRILHEAFRRQAHVVFLDESGFFLTPSVRRSLAPRGRTPILDCWDRRDRISAISCITLSPRLGRPGLYFELLPVNATVHGEEVVGFLEQLRRQLRGPFTVVWGRGKIHSRSKAVKA